MKVWDPNGTSKVSPMGIRRGLFHQTTGSPQIGLGTSFWFFHEILSFYVADFEYDPQNREYQIFFFNISIFFHTLRASRQADIPRAVSQNYIFAWVSEWKIQV